MIDILIVLRFRDNVHFCSCFMTVGQRQGSFEKKVNAMNGDLGGLYGMWLWCLFVCQKKIMNSAAQMVSPWLGLY